MMEKEKKKKGEIVFAGTVGDLSWIEVRDLLLVNLTKCDTEKKFNDLMKTLYISMGTKKELVKKRKLLKLSPFNKKELKEFNKK